MRDGPHDRARRGHAPCKPQRGDHRGCARRVERATTGATRHAPPPCRGTGAAPRACAVLALCLRHASNEGKTTSPPPPETPPPPQGWGMKEGRGGQRPPPPRTKRQGGEAVERGCGTDHTTVPEGSTRHASPSGGGRRGSERRVGRATTRATRQAPPPLQRDKCRASCLRRACDVLGPEDGQRGPPPHPLLPHPPRKGARTAKRWRGDMGGGTEDRPTCQGKRRAASGGDAKKKTTNKANQRARGRKREDRDQNGGERGEAGATWARRGRW